MSAGKRPATWPRVALSNVLELQRGHDLPSSTRGKGVVPVIGSFGITGYHDVARYDGPGVAIGRSGASIGTATYVHGGYWPLNTCLFVRDFKGNDPRWVYRLLDGIDFASFNSGSAQPSLNRNFLQSIPVAQPPVEEQRAIAEVLGVLDDKIAANAKLSSTSDALIRALYEAAIAKPGASIAPVLDACCVDFGEPFRGADFCDPGVGRPLVRIRDLKTFTPQVWTTEVRRAEVVIVPGDVVVGMDAEFRPTAWLGEPGLLNQRVCRVLGRDFGAAYTREALKVPLAEIEGSKSATTVIHLNKSDLARATVRVAKRTALQAFEAKAEVIYAHRVNVAVENRRLGNLRDALLPELMSGRLRVKDGERIVEGEV